MKFSKLSVIAMLGVAAMSSCSNDNELTSEKSVYVTSVRVTVEDFLPESPATRTSYTVDASGFNFHWADGDALGIYPVGGDQVKFPISQGDGSASASFDGGAWKLRSTYQYAAYYPFSADNYKIEQKALPVSFTGQTQNGNGSTAHLGAYDYLACAATSPSAGGGVDLTMKHLGAFVRLQLTMPKADTFSSVVIESDGAQFVTSGTFDLTAATPAITPTATSSTYTINLTNVATTEKDQVVTVYAIVAPANLSTSHITVTVHGAGQATYVQTVPGKNFEARSAYNIAVETFPSGTNASGENVSWEETPLVPHDYVDLGLPSGLKWATCNIGANNETESGLYFWWGDIQGHEKDDTSFDFSENNNKIITQGKYQNALYTSSIVGSKYRWQYGGSSDYYNVFDLTAQYDAATQKWGGDWRMPTIGDIKELIDNCTCKYINQGGKEGYTFTSSNGNSIFIPSAGYKIGTTVYYGNAGYATINSSSAVDSDTFWATQFPSFIMGLYDSFIGNLWSFGYRYYGRPIRPVCP